MRSYLLQVLKGNLLSQFTKYAVAISIYFINQNQRFFFERVKKPNPSAQGFGAQCLLTDTTNRNPTLQI